MTTIVAGVVPYGLNAPLPRNGSFLWTITNPTRDWAVDEGIELHFYAVDPGSIDDPFAIVWEATITGPVAAWDVPKANVQAVVDDGFNYVNLIYIDTAGEPIIWAKGRTNVY